LFAWLFVLHLGVGVFNLLPLKPFDGGYMYEEVFGKVFGRKGKFLSYVTSLFILSLILLNVGFALGLT
jgi:membrane-associated protease RseP (regulator of RpoE activity)